MRPASSARGHWKFFAVIGAVGLIAVACKPAITGTTSGPITFEQPTYPPGSINGSDGWVSHPTACGGDLDHEVDDTATSGTQPSAFGFGSQSLRISDASTTGCFGDQTFSKPTDDESGETGVSDTGCGSVCHSGGNKHGFFEATWSFADAGNPLVLQDGLHVVVSPDRGDGARMSWVSIDDCGPTARPDPDDMDPSPYECDGTTAGLQVNFSDYDQNGPDSNPENRFVFHHVVSGLSRGAAHSVRLRMWFFEGESNDVVQVCVDTTHCIVGGSWEDYFRIAPSQDTSTKNVDSLVFQTRATPHPANDGNGLFFDNVTLKSQNYTGAAFSIAGPSSVTEGSGGSNNATYTVTLSEALPFTTTVDYATANITAFAGSDYVGQSGTLTFDPGDTSETITVPIATDFTDEQLNEDFKVNLLNPTSIGLAGGDESFPSYAAIDTGSKTTTIKDDDSTVRVSDASQNEGNSGQANMPFTVSLDNASAVTVSIKAGTQNGSAHQPSDYAATTQVLTFMPGETSKTFNVPINGDATPEGNENFLVILTQQSNTAIGDGTGAGVIKNDD
jgi:hypothetical protein